MELRKVLFTDGMSNDGLIIVTDATIELVCSMIDNLKKCIEYGKSNYDMLEELKTFRYVKVLYDSEIDPPELKELIGWDESYDLSM